MSIFTKKQVDFDFYSAELIFFYIHEYTIFKEQGYCFYPPYKLVDWQYKEDDSSFVRLETKDDFVDLFTHEQVNLKVLCGKNGCGKSTLLEIMAGTKASNVEIKKFYLLKDKNGNFASSIKCNIFLDSESILLDSDSYYEFSPSTCCVSHKNMRIPDFDFRKNIVKFYTETPILYDGIVDGKLFTHFSVEIWNFDNEIELMATGNRKSMFQNENIFELKLWLKTDLLSYFLLHTFQDNTYDKAASMFEQQMNENNIDLQSFLENFVYTTYAPEIVHEIQKIQNSFLHKKMKISQIAEVEKTIHRCESMIFKFLEAFDKEMRKSRFVEAGLSSLLYFNGYSNESLPVRFLYNLSDGEWRSLKYRYEILHSMIQTDGFWWYIDEPESYLHPEWCRTFINDYINAYKEVKNYLISMNDGTFNPDKRFTLVFATHSPFLLSDLTNDYIIYLEKENGRITELKADKESFAGNIGEMYNTNFFMHNTIGEFARTRLMDIIERINKQEKVTDEILNEWHLLTSKIGDDLLRNLMKDRIQVYEKNRII